MFKVAKNYYQEKILRFYFTNPHRKHHLRALSRMLDLDPGNLSRQLKTLKEQGILKTEKVGGLKIFSLNKEHFLYPEYKMIVFKTIGIEGSLKKLVNKIPEVELALIYGSAAKNKIGPDSDIDLLLVSNVNEDELIKEINRLESQLMREINYTIYDKKEFQEKRRKKDSFIVSILREKHLILKGDTDETSTRRFSKNPD